MGGLFALKVRECQQSGVLVNLISGVVLMNNSTFGGKGV